MGDWKLLGEVPDSEDEDGFDSQGVNSYPARIEPTITGTADAEKAIWEIPESEDEPEPMGTSNYAALPSSKQYEDIVSIESSPLSSAQSIDDLPALEQILEDTHGHGVAQDKDARETFGDDVSKSYVRITAPTPTEYSMTEGAVPLRGDDPAANRLETMASQDLGHIPDFDAIQNGAMRLERSLRPRKPIQEHPYLLENAHYSSLFRKHGMRPVQMAAAMERRRREAATNDGDFEDDSQESSLPRLLDSSLRDSGQDSDDVRELDVFDIPSSSPLKTSPWTGRAVASSRLNSPVDTDNTSILDQDLPAVQDLVSRAKQHGPGKANRHRTTPGSAAQKRRGRKIIESDPAEPLQLESSPVESARISGDQLVHQHFESGPLPAIPQLKYGHKHNDTSRSHSLNKADVEIVSSEEVQDAAERDADGSASSAGEEGVYMNSIGRRIKGVLPASWLRLDQKTSRDTAQKNMQKRHKPRMQERENRRGVAQLRQTDNTAHGATGTNSMSPWFFEESEEEEPSRPNTTDDAFNNQTRLMLLPQQSERPSPIDLSDDDGSAMEDNSIDPMVVGQKRQQNLSTGVPPQKRRKLSSQAPKRKDSRQTKLTSHVDEHNRAGGQQHGAKRKSRKSVRTDSGRRPRPAVTPRKCPRLSVLDVIEPSAPPFIRVAARAARQRADQGRSSPSKKSIRLATRRDHIDALSVLHNWRTGLIQQRQSVTLARPPNRTQKPRQPLSETAGNKAPRAASRGERKVTSTAPRKFVKRVSNGGHVQYGPAKRDGTTTSTGSNHDLEGEHMLAVDDSGDFRSAQLEVGETDRAFAASFYKRKRFLDRLYTRHMRNTSASAFGTASEKSYRERLPTELNDIATSNRALPEGIARTKRHPRKKRRPVHVDVDAPQFQHAADPLPVQYAIEEAEHVPQHTTPSKLCGLGPYGTQYTTHFEIFPLDAGVHFHESTLIGSGALDALVTSSDTQRLLESRPRTNFQLGNQTLRWSLWNDQTSSELGVLLDTVADEIERYNSTRPNEAISKLGSKFLAAYVRDSLSFTDENGIKSFIARVLDVVKSFNGRIGPCISGWAASDKTSGGELVVVICDSLMLMTYAAMLLCRANTNFMSEQFQIEDLLRDLAHTSLSALVGIGVDHLLEVYANLQTANGREWGLRDDEAAIHSWVLAMQILDAAHIPRGSFWEVLKGVIAPKDKVITTDAQYHEQIWGSVFAVLPLCEFTPSGVLVPGKRHDTTTDGWVIPQQLLRQVFLLYRDDEHQAASFNNYCRALISRCHCLVQQWGWRRSGTVVGVIFDFFGSQSLAHLRNEEVHSSPRFLENLTEGPSLAVEPGDKCFHIFLKLLGLSIQKLREAGNMKDVRNLVARTIPNHNRQHLKEQTVYERDLAALRNHHDLLGTLFWAAPPDMRPTVSLIQRLVAPSTSHKEACLINIRSWNQLARFIVSGGEVTTAFKPFVQWRNSFFQESLQQFDSVASDIQQQLHSLPKDVTQTINRDMIDSMISLNKKAVIDVLRASVTASLDVMRRSADLEAASFCLNNIQLQHVFKHFSITQPEFDWAILRASLSTLESFLSRVDEFKDSEESQQSESQLLNSAQADDALIVVDNDLSKSYFSMVRCILSRESSSGAAERPGSDKSWCVEEAVILAARLGARFTHGGLIRLADMFKGGKYGLFEGHVQKLSPERRKYLVLFMANLLMNKIDDFGELEFGLCDLWMLSLAKPHGQLEYQSQLVDQLRQRGEFYVPNVNTVLPVEPDYTTNRDLFEFAISAMRRSIRDSGPTLKRTLMSEYSKSLKLVMEQMKEDLKTVLPNPTKHYTYVAFTRHIISLIKAYGPEICVVDDFFYQISPEYSPSPQDPNLQVAAMVSYGMRITEGDDKVAQQLFFFLFNNFKMAMVSNCLKDEGKKLAKGMKDTGIRQFVVGKMLPAALCASVKNDITFPLLDVYVLAAWRTLRRPAVCQLPEREVPMAQTVFTAVLSAFRGILTGGPPSTRTIHVLRQAIATANILWPFVYSLPLNTASSPAWTELVTLLEQLNKLVQTVGSNIGDAVSAGDFATAATRLLAGVMHDDIKTIAISDMQVLGFADNIAQDAERSWTENAGRITARTPAKPQEELGQGVYSPQWDMEKVLQGLNNHVHEWRYWWDMLHGVSCPTKRLNGIMF